MPSRSCRLAGPLGGVMQRALERYKVSCIGLHGAGGVEVYSGRIPPFVLSAQHANAVLGDAEPELDAFRQDLVQRVLPGAV